MDVEFTSSGPWCFLHTYADTKIWMCKGLNYGTCMAPEIPLFGSTYLGQFKFPRLNVGRVADGLSYPCLSKSSHVYRLLG